MPVFSSENLNSQKICESYPKLLQIYSGSLVLNGTGSLIQTLDVTASYALNCSCEIGESITGYFCSSSVWTFNHNLGSKFVIIQVYDQDDNQILPEIVNLYNENTAILTFDENVCGTVVASLGGANKAGESIKGFFCSSSVWTFNHNLGTKYVVVQAYDENDNQIIPEIVNLYDENTTILTFDENVCGTVVASLGGLNVVTQSFYLETGSLYPITSSWSAQSVTSSYIQTTNVSYPVKKIYNNYNVVKTNDYTLLCDATSGSFNVVLPNPVGNTNIFNIKKIDRTNHCIHVMVTNTSSIDYDVTQSICHRGTNMTVQSDGTTQYWIL